MAIEGYKARAHTYIKQYVCGNRYYPSNLIHTPGFFDFEKATRKNARRTLLFTEPAFFRSHTKKLFTPIYPKIYNEYLYKGMWVKPSTRPGSLSF